MRDDEKIIRLLKTASGQIDGVVRMVEEKKYCIDISNQIMAAQANLSKGKKERVNGHLHFRVVSSIKSGDANEKMNEISAILAKLLKQ